MSLDRVSICPWIWIHTTNQTFGIFFCPKQNIITHTPFFVETHGKAFWSVNTCTCPSVFYVYHFAVSDAELEQFVVQVIEANNRGVSAARNVSNEPNWSFGQSLFFAGTILTTIGKSYEDIMKLCLYKKNYRHLFFAFHWRTLTCSLEISDRHQDTIELQVLVYREYHGVIYELDDISFNSTKHHFLYYISMRKYVDCPSSCKMGWSLQ